MAEPSAVVERAALEKKLFCEIEECAARFEKFMRAAAAERRRDKFDSEESLRNKANEQAIMIIARVRRLRAVPSEREKK